MYTYSHILHNYKSAHESWVPMLELESQTYENTHTDGQMHRKGSKLLKFIYSEKNLEQNSSIWFNMETVCLPFPGLTAVRRGLLSLICLSYASFSSSFAFSFSIPLVDGQKRPTVCVEMVVDGLCGAPSGVLTGNHEAYKCKYIIMKDRWSKKQTVSQKSINIFCIFNQFYIVCSLLANQRKI